MKKLTLLLIFCFPLITLAQLRKGLVTDKTGEPIDGATIGLRRGDSTIAIQTSKNGLFSFPQPFKGSYMLKVNAVGYQNTVQALNLPMDSVVIVMISDDRTLEQLTLSA